jgi:bacillithiol synthase
MSDGSPSAAEVAGVDLAAAGKLPPLVAALLAGRDADLLAPLRSVAPGRRPAGDPPRVERQELAAALGAANRACGHPGADRLAARLADPTTRVVVTGQQPGLFGGPLYTLSKALAAARWAAALEAAGEPAVALFWVATEDHDYDEVARATVLTREGPRSFDLGEDPEPLAPLGARSLGPRVAEVVAEIAALGGSPGWGDWWRQVGEWYRPAARFGEAFARLLVRILGAHCPLLVDSQLPELKEAQRPWLTRLVERRREVEEAYAAGDARIAGRGYPLQVTPQPGLSPLFLLAGGQRRRIEWRGEAAFALRGGDGGEAPVGELLGRIADNPISVSPGVLARPAVQDAVLGTSLQVVGAAELSYLAQVAPLYALLGIAAPEVALRPQVVVLDDRQREKLAASGVELADLVGDAEALDRRLAAGVGRELTAAVAERFAAELDHLKTPALALDPNLESPWRKTRDTVLRAVETFSGKVTAAAARADEVRRRRVEELRAACLPGGRPQERVIASAYFPGRYGEGFAAALYEQLDLDPRRLQPVHVKS